MKANGLVRLRSPESLGRGGKTSTPTVNVPFSIDEFAPPFLICSKTSVSWSPRKTEIIAGGASLAPKRWSFPAEATTERKQALILVDGSNHCRTEDKELRVVVRRVTGIQEIALRAATQGPIDMLTRSIDAGKRLFVH